MLAAEALLLQPIRARKLTVSKVVENGREQVETRWSLKSNPSHGKVENTRPREILLQFHWGKKRIVLQMKTKRELAVN